MIPFLALVKKDLHLFFQDRRALLMSFLAPIIMGAFFGYVFGGSSNKDPGKTKVLFADQDQSAVSRQIAAKLQGEKSLQIESTTAEIARVTVQKGKAPVAVIIPPAFGKNATDAFVRSTNVSKPKLNILIDPSHQMEAQMIEGMLTGHVMQAVSQEAIGGVNGRAVAADGLKELENDRTLPPDQRKALMAILDGASKYNAGSSGGTPFAFTIPFESQTESLTSAQGVAYNAYGHSFGGFAVQFILFLGIDVGIGLLLTRQRGLWQRFRAAPLSKAQLLGSRAVSATIISLIILCVVFIVARLLFQVRIEGSLPGFLAVGVALGFMTATYGLLIATLGKTPEAARGLSILGTLVMVMLSGAWVPSFVFPAWLQSFTKIVPARWAVDGLDGMVWRGLPFTEAIAPTLVLLAFAALFGAIAIARFRWDEN